MLFRSLHLEVAERLGRLRAAFGNFEMEDGWATASVILSRMEASEAPEVAGAEKMPPAPGVWGYLVRAEALDEVLGELFEGYLTAG